MNITYPKKITSWGLLRIEYYSQRIKKMHPRNNWPNTQGIKFYRLEE